MINVVSIGPPSSTSGDADVDINVYAQDRYPSPGSDSICRHFLITARMVQGRDGNWDYDGPATVQVDREVPGDPTATREHRRHRLTGRSGRTNQPDASARSWNPDLALQAAWP